MMKHLFYCSLESIISCFPGTTGSSLWAMHPRVCSRKYLTTLLTLLKNCHTDHDRVWTRLFAQQEPFHNHLPSPWDSYDDVTLYSGWWNGVVQNRAESKASLSVYFHILRLRSFLISRTFILHTVVNSLTRRAKCLRYCRHLPFAKSPKPNSEISTLICGNREIKFS